MLNMEAVGEFEKQKLQLMEDDGARFISVESPESIFRSFPCLFNQICVLFSHYF